MFVSEKVSSLKRDTLIFREKARGKSKISFCSAYQVALVGIAILKYIHDFISILSAFSFPSLDLRDTGSPGQCKWLRKFTETVFGINFSVVFHYYGTCQCMPDAGFNDANQSAQKFTPSLFVTFPRGELSPAVGEMFHVKRRNSECFQAIDPIALKVYPLVYWRYKSSHYQRIRIIRRSAAIEVSSEHSHKATCRVPHTF